MQDMTDIQEPLTKESENLFSFWCSGRLVSHIALIQNLESIFKTTFVVQDLLRGHAGGAEVAEKTRPGKRFHLIPII